MPEPAPLWALENFIDVVDIWIGHEDPPGELRRAVLTWIFTRAEDPYQGVQGAEGFAKLAFRPVPRTVSAGTVVSYSYWIEEQRHTVRCDSVATPPLPL